MPKRFIKTIGFGIVILLITGIWLAIGDYFATNPYIIGVVRNTTYSDIAYKLYRNGRIKLYSDNFQSLHELAAGRVDAVIDDRLVGLNMMKNTGYHNLKMAGKLLNREIIGIAFDRKDKALRQKINQALKEIINNGTYAGISIEYFGCNILKGSKYSLTHPDEQPATDDSWNRVKKSGQIIFAMDGERPFCYYNNQNELTGFDIEIAQAICNRLNVKFVPVHLTWEGIVEGLKAEHFDGVLGNMVITKQEEIDFSNPYYITGAQLFFTRDSLITGPKILKKSSFK